VGRRTYRKADNAPCPYLTRGSTHPRPVSEGIPFLGFVIYPNHRRLKRRKGIYYRRRLRRLAAAYRAGEVPLDAVQASVRGWINDVRYANTVGLRKAVFRSVSFTAPKEHRR